MLTDGDGQAGGVAGLGFGTSSFQNSAIQNSAFQNSAFQGSGFQGSGFQGSGFGAEAGSHTLVVHRDQDGGGREPFLQRWLFSPRLAIVALIVALLVGLGFGGWWLTSGRYAKIPVVAGDSVSQATTALTTDGFRVAKVSQEHSNTVARGTVIGTNPSGRAAKGAAIMILASAGPFTSAVPSVTGEKLAAAEADLQKVHLTWTVQKVGSTSPVGTVVGTKPGAGTSWPQTKPVTLQVAEGLPVPNFVGQNVQVAQDWATAHNVNFQQQQDQNSSQPQGTVTQQQPDANAVYQQGESLTVTVSTGPAEINVPDVIGMSVADATQQLQAAGFQVQVESFGLGGDNGNRRVWNYSPIGTAPRGSVILLDVLPGSNGGLGL
jgi:serine/threonine-protein kinase